MIKWWFKEIDYYNFTWSCWFIIFIMLIWYDQEMVTNTCHTQLKNFYTHNFVPYPLKLPSDSLSHGHGWDCPRVQPIWVTLGRADHVEAHLEIYYKLFMLLPILCLNLNWALIVLMRSLGECIPLYGKSVERQVLKMHRIYKHFCQT